MTFGKCRCCGAELKSSFTDLGMSPLSNSYLTVGEESKEGFYPLHALVCDACFLVQLEEFESPENIFSDYAYFSSYSQSWLDHAKSYSDRMIERFDLNTGSKVVEIASNDGYLLQNFVQKNIRVLGVEPAANVAKVAQEKGVDTTVRFFNKETAAELITEGQAADLIVANNVLAHVPDLNGFVAGFKILLKPEGAITIEFPHLLELMTFNQFDTIYHEHFSYFSLLVVQKVMKNHGLRVFDVEELSTHGGSLRIFACHEKAAHAVTPAVQGVLDQEKSAGLDTMAPYQKFDQKVVETKSKVLEFLHQAKKDGKTVVGYGAPAKGNTLLNYCGVTTELMAYTTDLSPHKQNKLLPGTHLPIHAPDKIFENQPDYIFILPWNLKDEIIEQMSKAREWGAQFVIPIPTIEIIK